MTKTLSTISLSIACLFSSAQTDHNLFNFEQLNDVQVLHNGDTLTNPWAGGIDYAQVNTIDLDLDGIQDLLVYDRHSTSVQTYVTRNTGGQNHYEYAPEYISQFPRAYSWMLLRDYNCDGKKDVFYNTNSNIFVLTNNSSGNELSFSNPLTIPIQTLYSSGPSNLYVSKVNIPAIVDIDDDGDLDVLTYGSGIEMEFHENKQNCGLDFELAETCWGHFTESGFYRSVSLNACLPHKKKGLHEGSSILALDLNNDNVKDLILGNILFRGMTAVNNGGTVDSAHMTSQDTTFPAYDTPIDVPMFPAAFYEDVDFDGKPDLLVSPAEQASGSINKHSLLFYKNTGTTGNPDFSFQKDNFLQDEMIEIGEGAVPRLVDLNNDSLLDMVVANNNYMLTDSNKVHAYYYYENTGSSSDPVFTLVDNNFLNISQYGLGLGTIPAFGDLDNDGDQDMIIGAEDGTLYYFTNGSASTPLFSFSSALSGIDVGNNAAPFLFDIDGDNSLDLIIGNQAGTLWYYTNSSATNPSFTYVTDYFGGVNTHSLNSSQGQSIPCLFEKDSSINVFTGSFGDGILQYDSIAKVLQQPPILNGTVGNGNLMISNTDETPFAFTNRNGRSQFLVKASELESVGLGYGYVMGLTFDVASSGTYYIKLTIRLKNVPDTALNQFHTGMSNSFYDQYTAVNNGLNYYQFSEPFLWDGSSNLVVEVCYGGLAFTGSDLAVRMTDVGFKSNAYDTPNPSSSENLCNQVYKGSSTKRPNMKFKINPAFAKTNSYSGGRRTAPAVGDLNNDGFMDMIVGNYNGGLHYFQGKFYDIGLEENVSYNRNTSLQVYPNPGTGQFTILSPNEGEATLGVFDLTGKMIHSKIISETQTTIDISDKPAGIYIFVLNGGDYLLTQKVILGR